MPSGIKVDTNTSIDTILLADDQAIFQNIEDDLQRAIFKLPQLYQLYNMKILIAKTKTTAFKEKKSIRTKLILDKQILKLISDFRYLGYDASFYKNKDLDNKLHKFQQICGSLRRNLENKPEK